MLESELMHMVEAGCALIAATATPDGEPRAARAWAVEMVDADRFIVRIVLSADDPVTVDNLRIDAALALTGANVRTLRAVQLKGRVRSVRAPSHADIDLMAHHSSAFLRAVHESDGTPVALLERMLPSDVCVVDLEVIDAFDQSPGPDAGAAVAVDAR